MTRTDDLITFDGQAGERRTIVATDIFDREKFTRDVEHGDLRAVGVNHSVLAARKLVHGRNRYPVHDTRRNDSNGAA